MCLYVKVHAPGAQVSPLQPDYVHDLSNGRTSSTRTVLYPTYIYDERRVHIAIYNLSHEARSAAQLIFRQSI